MTTTLRQSTLAVLAAVSAIAIGSCGGAPPPKAPVAEAASGPATHEASFTPPGDCVDPVSDGDTHDPTRPFDKHVQVDVHTEDLEGDGVIDEFVMPAWSCGTSCYRSAYLIRGTCGYYLGTFPTSDRYQAVDHKSHGLRDLETHPMKADEEGRIHCYQAVLSFDGKRYVESKRRECECKEHDAKCTAWP